MLCQKPGGTSEHSCASSRPAKSLVYELPLLFTIPVSDPAESPGRVMIELLFFTRRHFATVSLRLSSKRSVLFCEITRSLATPEAQN